MFILRARGQKVVPLTKSATMRYARPVRLGAEYALKAEIVREAASPKDSVLIRTSIMDANHNALSEADFEYVLLPQERFMKAVEIEQMPDSYRRHFGDL